MVVRFVKKPGFVVFFAWVVLCAPIARAATGALTCDTAEVAALLQAQFPQQVSRAEVGSCGITLHMATTTPGQQASIWFSFLPGGDIQSTTNHDQCDEKCRQQLGSLESDALALVESSPHWAHCSNLTCPRFAPPEATAAAPPAQETLATQSPMNPAVASVYAVVALAWLGLLLAALWLLAGKLRKQWPHLVGALCSSGLAFVVRAVSSPRLPSAHALLDFAQFADVLQLLDGTSASQTTLSPLYLPSQALLSWALLGSFGSGMDAYFWVTTALGALCSAAAYVLGLQWTRTTWGAVLCALAVACSPVSILFSNGYNIETLMGLLLLVNLCFFTKMLRTPSLPALLGHTASLVLLAHGRGESLLLGAALGFLQFVALLIHSWPADKAGIGWVLRRTASFWAAGLLCLPLAFALVAALPRGSEGLVAQASNALPKALGLALVMALPALLLLRPPAGDFGKALAWTGTLILLFFGGCLCTWVATQSPHSPWWPQAFTLPQFPFAWLYSVRPEGDAVDVLGTVSQFVLSPALFPICWIPLLLVSLSPTRGTKDSLGAPMAWLSASWLALFGLLFGQIADGVVPMPGARYMVTALPLISLLVGLGATRLLHLAPSGRVRWSVATLLVATLLLPTLTHRSVYSDTLRNPQHEFLFAMDVQRFMDPQTLVIVPDHGPSGEVHDPEGAVGISWFRTWALYRTLSHLKGLGEWGVSTLGDLPKRQESGQRRLLFVMTTDCYRHRLAQTLAPLCQRVAALPGTRTLLQTTFPNRIMTQASFTYDLGPRVPEIELRLLELPPMDGPTLSLLLAPKNP